ncbi:hypothetical protein LTR60_006369, partial [Cryomyces antarcticus]
NGGWADISGSRVPQGCTAISTLPARRAAGAFAAYQSGSSRSDAWNTSNNTE